VTSDTTLKKERKKEKEMFESEGVRRHAEGRIERHIGNQG
jgi:hypothetical protein